MLCVPLRVGGALLGVISAFSTRPAVFTAHHQRVLEAFAEQAGIAVQNAQLFEESVRRARGRRARCSRPAAPSPPASTSSAPCASSWSRPGRCSASTRAGS